MSTSCDISRYKYAAVAQDQDGYFGFDDSCEVGQSGSDMNYHEMSEVDSNDDLSTTNLDNLDQNMHFWPTSRNRNPAKSKRSKGLNLFKNIMLWILFSLVIILSIAIFFIMKQSTQVICTSRSCVMGASGIASSMDETIDPCDDFYAFACNGWKRNNPIPPGRTKFDSFDKQSLSVDKALKNILEQITLDSNHSAEYKAKLMYDACNDVEEIDSYGIQPLVDLIKEAGGWNISGNWDSNKFDLNGIVKEVGSYGVDVFFSIYVDSDFLSADSNILMIGPMGLTLGQAFYLNKTMDDPVLSAYHEYMTNVAILLGGEKNISMRLMQDVLEFEKKLAEIQRPPGGTSMMDDYVQLTLADIVEVCSVFDWMDYLNSSFIKYLPNEQINLTEPIGTSDVAYLKNLSSVVQSTPTETLNTYVVWQLVYSYIGGLGHDFEKLKTELKRKIYGVDTSKCSERWKTCSKTVDSSFGLPIGRLFVEKYFNQESRSMAKNMVKEIKDSFKRNLPKASWLDEETRKTAEQKVDAVKDAIGYPDYITNKTKMDNDFMELNFTKGMNFFSLLIELRKFGIKDMFSKLRKPVDKDMWEMTPSTLNAYYSPTKNKIVFPAGILQPPAYKSDFPQSINFGGIGFVVGHELTHGFDDEGRKFDLNGNLHNWWKNSTAEKFKRKSECLAQQYSHYEVFGVKLNGNLTVDENIADNGGLRLAYEAYMHWKKSGDGLNDPLLPSLEYTHEQLFFISFAQVWCASDTASRAKQSMVTNTHSPNNIRVIGAVRNMPKFSAAFHCPVGSKMNPAKKCVVW